ncbi:MAG: sugar phosphate isomerase/epimerase [Chloroflexi bacterium]|nr:sugar phosphate isomerase/epimerase [Chloroflexota bacterium]
MPSLSISTWSLHHELGASYAEPETPGGERKASYPWGQGNLSLLEVPDKVAAMGIPNLEICHFHFPRTDAEYLAELRGRIQAAGLTFFSLLIDSGDITASDPEKQKRDMDWIRSWIDIASATGARNVRVIAGDARPDPEAVQTSIRNLHALVEYGRERGVGVMTENWHELTMRPENVLAILDGLGGSVGLCADMGNYSGPTKYEDLKAIMPRAASIHTKARYSASGDIDSEDFRRYLDLSRDAGFKGPYVLIFDTPGDEWASLAKMKEIVSTYL